MRERDIYIHIDIQFQKLQWGMVYSIGCTTIPRLQPPQFPHVQLTIAALIEASKDLFCRRCDEKKNDWVSQLEMGGEPIHVRV